MVGTNDAKIQLPNVIFTPYSAAIAAPAGFAAIAVNHSAEDNPIPNILTNIKKLPIFLLLGESGNEPLAIDTE